MKHPGQRGKTGQSLYEAKQQFIQEDKVSDSVSKTERGDHVQHHSTQKNQQYMSSYTSTSRGDQQLTDNQQPHTDIIQALTHGPMHDHPNTSSHDHHAATTSDTSPQLEIPRNTVISVNKDPMWTDKDSEQPSLTNGQLYVDIGKQSLSPESTNMYTGDTTGTVFDYPAATLNTSTIQSSHLSGSTVALFDAVSPSSTSHRARVIPLKPLTIDVNDNTTNIVRDTHPANVSTGYPGVSSPTFKHMQGMYEISKMHADPYGRNPPRKPVNKQTEHRQMTDIKQQQMFAQNLHRQTKYQRRNVHNYSNQRFKSENNNSSDFQDLESYRYQQRQGVARKRSRGRYIAKVRLEGDAYSDYEYDAVSSHSEPTFHVIRSTAQRTHSPPKASRTGSISSLGRATVGLYN